MREVLLEVMKDNGVWKASLKVIIFHHNTTPSYHPLVERLCALLDPRRKALGAYQLVNGSAALRIRAEEDLKGVIAEVADAQTQPSAPVPAPVLKVGPAESTPY